MFKTFFTTIPKSVNEFIFVLGLLGIVFLLRKNKKKGFLAANIVIILIAMTVWRGLFNIVSSRYAVGLLFPYVICSAFFISELLRGKNRLSKFVLIGLITSMSISWFQKNYVISRTNSNIEIASEIHERYNRKKQEYIFFTHSTDAERIAFLGKGYNQIKKYNTNETISDLVSYITNYRRVPQGVLFDIVINSKEPSTISIKQDKSKYRFVSSFFTQKNKKKKHCIYLIQSKAKCEPISLTQKIIPESGILKNGDLELIDNPETSYEKLKKHINQYALFYGFDKSIRTPENAYFHNPPRLTQTLPSYNCSDSFPISGKYSAVIKNNSKNGVSYILFYQKNKEGIYEYSFLVKGTRGTKVCLLYDLYKKGRWEVTNLALFEIPDNKLYKLESTFCVNDISENEYFLVGAWVQSGEAKLDNFCLKRIDDESSIKRSDYPSDIIL